ncbi:MAG TPA: thioredoxin family protein [Candidatus Deferrimicrobiaceae bacterium]
MTAPRFSPKRFLASALLMLAIVPCLAHGAAAAPDPADLARDAGRPVIADFGLGLCKQCKQQTATLKEIEAAYGDRVVVRMVMVNREQALVDRYKVELIPTLVFFDPAGKEAFRKVGPLPYKEIRDQLARMGVKEKRK